MDDLPLKKSAAVAKALAAKIVRGELTPGEKLRQDYIAQEHGVSQVTTREALLQLSAQGLAISIPRRGVCVAALDKGAIEEIRLMRQALEPLALQHSVAQLSPSDVTKIDTIRKECDNAETATQWEEANRAFHNAIIARCGMPRLIEEVGNLQLLYARHFFERYAETWRPRADPDHLAIVAAIKERNASKASAVLLRHLTRLS